MHLGIPGCREVLKDFSFELTSEWRNGRGKFMCGERKRNDRSWNLLVTIAFTYGRENFCKLNTLDEKSVRLARYKVWNASLLDTMILSIKSKQDKSSFNIYDLNNLNGSCFYYKLQNLGKLRFCVVKIYFRQLFPL